MNWVTTSWTHGKFKIKNEEKTPTPPPFSLEKNKSVFLGYVLGKIPQMDVLTWK